MTAGKAQRRPAHPTSAARKPARPRTKRDLLDLGSLSADELARLLALAARLKDELRAGLEHPYLRGRTLGSYLEDFGGFEGEVTQHTTGRRFGISLEPWRGRDPQTTRLDVSFITDL